MTPVLYSFRRCPYAMRARLAIAYANTPVALREIVLKAKPEHMLQISPKGTVPVLQIAEQQVIEESLAIMFWALRQQDKDQWLGFDSAQMRMLITENDGDFKQALDKYKYHDRFPEQTQAEYRQQGERFVAKLEQRLSQNSYLMGPRVSLADMAILPFIRQFAHVNWPWFEQSPYPHVKAWLNQFKESDLFKSIMVKYPTWLESQQHVEFPA
ncbi:glutathione S-transferase [Motilimonas pumila]|uniref:Glutathione S-transferase n=1 Tax=Motilimonas pumila TaxID=2303987 RepID=A0A418YFQ6_9GAMM|nr:glutathione S-transferase [Motilimonas pumila]RJG48210.1 glutathione S-transferase [Motilimonas pumila]